MRQICAELGLKQKADPKNAAKSMGEILSLCGNANAVRAAQAGVTG